MNRHWATDKYWTTADGRQIPLSEMTDDHMQNTILYLRRRALKLWSLDQRLYRIAGIPPTRLLSPMHDVLKAELTRRLLESRKDMPGRDLEI